MRLRKIQTASSKIGRVVMTSPKMSHVTMPKLKKPRPMNLSANPTFHIPRFGFSKKKLY